MIKQLLSVAIMGGFALSAAASIPCPIKHNNDWQKAGDGYAADGNGMCYEPSSSGSVAEATDPNFVVTCHAIPDEGFPGINDGAPFSQYKYQDPNSGFQWQTASIKATTDDLKITKNHVVVAWDYKTNKVANMMTVYFIYAGVMNGAAGDFFSRDGRHMTPSDEWQTCYMYAPIKGHYNVDATGVNSAYGRPEDFGIFADASHAGSDYLWIRIDDLKRVDNPDFMIQIKQPRWLTLEEADAEIAAANLTGDQPVVIGTVSPNSDILVDYDDASGNYVYVTQGENPCVNLYNPSTRLYDGNTKFSVEYQVIFGEETEQAPVAILNMNYQERYVGYQLAGISGAAIMSAEYPIDGDEWGVMEYNFENIDEAAFMTQQINTSGLWLQFRPDASFPEGSMFYLRNAKWSNPGTSGIENITGDDANAPAVYYNLQGVQVANPANGLYIKKQGNTTTKVLVK